ncbi:MAG: CAP domain-containing protein [Actinobacteria bacterium]|nr:CAP domain-containing protein [Actinomycetota bacterium]
MRRTRLTILATAIAASLTVSASSAHAAACTGASLLPAVASVATAKSATLCLLNAERGARGLVSLSSQPTLETTATSYSQAMVRQSFFSHVSPGGQTVSDRLASYVGSASSWRTGENLAWGEGTLATPSAIVRGWMASPSHRTNILNGAFREIGIGIAGGTPKGSLPAISATYTTHFGTRTPASSSSTRVSVASLSTGTRSTKRISAKKKKQISKRCHRVARRTKASKKTRTARYKRCMRTQLRAAKKR